MESISALLFAIKCGLCKSSLTQRFDEDGVVKYKCNCSLKVRTVLICTKCNKRFLTLPYLIRKTNYCSLDCYWTGTNKKQPRFCKSCGKKFYADATLIKKGYGFYCSRDCWFALFKKWKKAVKCKQCSKEFLVIRAVYEKKPKYCSKICKDNAEIDQISSICKGCKTNFSLPKSAIERGRGSFCTWECYKKYKGETSIELIVRQQLQKLNEPFQQEVRFGKFRADFYLPNRNIIIECDGKYWHGSELIKERDRRKESFLKEQGFKVIRLSEDGIRQDISKDLMFLLTN